MNEAIVLSVKKEHFKYEPNDFFSPKEEHIPFFKLISYENFNTTDDITLMVKKYRIKYHSISSIDYKFQEAHGRDEESRDLIVIIGEFHPCFKIIKRSVVINEIIK